MIVILGNRQIAASRAGDRPAANFAVADVLYRSVQQNMKESVSCPSARTNRGRIAAWPVTRIQSIDDASPIAVLNE
ncbi:MAG: hypothetical protein AAFY11_10485 [Cyanobacteria bacterium J06641_5]